MSSYDDLVRRSRYDFVCSLAVTTLRETGSLRSCLFSLTAHTSLVEDVLQKGSMEKVLEIPSSHIYFEHWKRDCEIDGRLGLWPWDRLVQHRAHMILGMKHHGFETPSPVEIFCDNGGAVYFHGHHRLATAAVLKIATIPVRRYALSKELAALAWDLFDIYSEPDNKKLYQPVDHPFFLGVPVFNARLDDKIAVVLDVLKSVPKDVPVLDLGANAGRTARAVQKDGRPVTAIDFDERMARIQPLLHAIGQASVPWVHGHIERVLPAREAPHAVVMLGLMHHYTMRADLLPLAETVLVPWMQRNVRVAVIEHEVQMRPGAVLPTETNEAVVAWWKARGFDAKVVFEEPAARRNLFALHRRS